jgi:hypothetical protein
VIYRNTKLLETMPTIQMLDIHNAKFNKTDAGLEIAALTGKTLATTRHHH